MIHRFVQVNDPHISDQPPRFRTRDYLVDVLQKLSHAASLANEHNAVLVITGDLFHRKNAAHTTHRTVQMIRDAISDAPEVLIVPGNHDAAHGGGLYGQPLLSVVDHDRVRLLTGVDNPDTHIVGGVPWSNRFEREGGAALFAQRVRDLGCRLVFAHAPIADRPWPFGRAVTEGWIERDAFAEVDLGPTRLIGHGHMHPEQMPALVGGVVWANPGALSRGTVARHDRDRVPSVALIEYATDNPDEWQTAGKWHPSTAMASWGFADGATLTVTYLTIPHRPASEVFRLDEVERDHEHTDLVGALSARLRGADAEVVTPELFHDWINELPRPDDVDEEQWRRGVARAHAAVDEGEVDG